MMSQNVCLSVHSSDTFPYYVETPKHVLKLFHRVATPFYFFTVTNVMAIFRREPSNGTSNAAVV